MLKNNMMRLYMTETSDDLGALKTDVDIDEDVKKIAKLMMVNKDDGNIRYIGSYSYKAIKNFSDVDMMEEVEMNSRECLIKFFVDSLKKTLRDILQSHDIYFMEVKAGIDKRFKLNIGRCNSGYFFADGHLIDNIKKLFDTELLPARDYNIIVNHARGCSQADYEIIEKILRGYYIVRWSPTEIFKGVKELAGGRSMSLNEAVQYYLFCNMECVFKDDNGIYKDISNYFVLQYDDPDVGAIVALNAEPYAVGNYYDYIRETLSKSIEKLYYSKLERSLLKLCKRYFSFARLFGYSDMLVKSASILNSDIGRLGMVLSMLKCIKKLNEKFKIDMSGQILKANTVLKTIPFNNGSAVIGHLYNGRIDEGINALNNVIEGEMSIYLKFQNLIPPPPYAMPLNKTF